MSAATTTQHLTLYEHTQELVDLMHQRNEATDPEEQTEIDLAITHHVSTARDKIDRCSHALAHLETISAAAGEEMQRLRRRQQQADDAATRLRAYLIAVMQANHMTRIDGHTSGFSLRRNAPTVDIPDEDALPGEFLVWTETAKPDRKRIKAALAAGQPVDGARLIQTTSLVRR